MKKLRILVIDDTSTHLNFAKEQLSEKYDLTLASSFDEAEKILNHGGHRYEEGEPRFDVLLTDMMLPASIKGVEKGVYPEQPYGLVFILNAMRRGIKLIGLLTNGGHHASPMHWALDMIGYEDQQKVFKFCDTKLYCEWLCLSEKERRDNIRVKDWQKALDELLKAE